MFYTRKFRTFSKKKILQQANIRTIIGIFVKLNNIYYLTRNGIDTYFGLNGVKS